MARGVGRQPAGPLPRGGLLALAPCPASAIRAARILLLGLAPAKDGGNRTGRVFTGDRSGDFLFAALHRLELANQPSSERADDGLHLHGAYVAAAVRCAPPANKPLPDERDRCAPFLHRELALLPRLRVIVALGAFAWEAALRAVEATSGVLPRPVRRFGHGAEAARRSLHAPRHVPPEPAEHLHRPPDRRHAGRGAAASPRSLLIRRITLRGPPDRPHLGHDVRAVTLPSRRRADSALCPMTPGPCRYKCVRHILSMTIYLDTSM